MKREKVHSAKELLDKLIQIQSRTVEGYEQMGEDHFQYKQEAKNTLGWLKSWRDVVEDPTAEEAKAKA